MSAAPEEWVRGSDTPEGISAVGSTFNSTTKGRQEGCRVMRRPEQLRLHPTLDDLSGIGVVEELNDATRLGSQYVQSVLEPIVITESGVILAGFGRWRLALFEGQAQVPCLIYPLTDEEVLPFILTHHRPSHVWNDFVRIRLALTQKPDFQQKALANMRSGGKCKGSTNLLEADRINVCRQIANLAGTGTTNVGKVETILRKAHPNITAALQNGSLRIHPAWSWCKLSKLEQLDEFGRYEEKRTRRKILQELSERRPGALQLSEVVEVLQRVEARKPGSIVVHTSRSKLTLVILGEDSLAVIDGQKED